MKKIFLLFLFTCFISFGQTNLCPFSYTGTDSNATIAITQENAANFMITDDTNTISISDIECPIEIGVIASDWNGIFCAGSSSWTNEENFAIAAWSDDSTSPEIDGMLTGSNFAFAICIEGCEDTFYSSSVAISNITGGGNTFTPNGMYLLESVVFNCSSSVIDDLSQSCSSIDITENRVHKSVIKTVDLLGRDFNPSVDSGVYLELYDDKSVSKVCRF
ncbi:MAG: hypothetical protein CMD27_00550 [Flavobacteriales bacterium]|nr:hypothetical protein [Flavobacteriales bacterium]